MADTSMVRCFPHVINLACKAVLAAVTKIELAHETAEDHVPDPTGIAPPWYFQDAMKRDPIASLCSLIRNVCISTVILVCSYIYKSTSDPRILASPNILPESC
jgi:hypothetical protein